MDTQTQWKKSLRKNFLYSVLLVILLSVLLFIVYDNSLKNCFKSVGSLNEARACHMSILMNDGNVLIIGGSVYKGGLFQYKQIPVNSIEVFETKKKKFKLLLKDDILAKYGNHFCSQTVNDDYINYNVIKLANDTVLLFGRGSSRIIIYDYKTNTLNQTPEIGKRKSIDLIRVLKDYLLLLHPVSEDKRSREIEVFDLSGKFKDKFTLKYKKPLETDDFFQRLDRIEKSTYWQDNNLIMIFEPETCVLYDLQKKELTYLACPDDYNEIKYFNLTYGATSQQIHRMSYEDFDGWRVSKNFIIFKKEDLTAFNPNNRTEKCTTYGVYDIDNKKFYDIGKPPSGCQDCHVDAINHETLLFSNCITYKDMGFTHFSETAHTYNVKSKEFKPAGRQNGKADVSSISLKDGRVLITGGDEISTFNTDDIHHKTLRSAELYIPEKKKKQKKEPPLKASAKRVSR